MADEVGGCDALVHALLSVEPDIPNADDLILRAAVATTYVAEQGSLRCENMSSACRFRFSFLYQVLQVLQAFLWYIAGPLVHHGTS